MPTDDRVKDEKIQYDINREFAKISVLLSGKANKYISHLNKYILTNILQAKKYYFLIENK